LGLFLRLQIKFGLGQAASLPFGFRPGLNLKLVYNSAHKLLSLQPKLEAVLHSQDYLLLAIKLASIALGGRLYELAKEENKRVCPSRSPHPTHTRRAHLNWILALNLSSYATV